MSLLSISKDDESWELEIPGAPDNCSYLPGQTTHIVYRLAASLSETRYEQLLNRGWRRFGRTLFRPACQNCRACQSLRVCVGDFQPSRNQRRVLARVTKSLDIQLHVRKPGVTPEHLELYNLYHADMHQRRQWPLRQIERREYAEAFVDGEFSFAREFQYRLNGKLIAVGLVDVTPNTLSSVYFFHDPEFRRFALGTWSVLREIDFARQHGRQYLHMGFYIRECQSMNYKNRFQPCEILQTRSSDQEEPLWLLQDAPAELNATETTD